jgi:hypothetical protein
MTGSVWQSSGASTNSTVVTAASAPDPKGANSYGYKSTATGSASGDFALNSGPGISTLPDGTCTFEVLATVTGGPVELTLFGGGQFKAFHLGLGMHHLCFPVNMTPSAARSFSFQYKMPTGSVLTLTRFMVFAGYYNQRDFNLYGSAAPTSVTYSWERGTRVINAVPTIGQPKAWTCSTSGAPGTWTSEGNL